LFAAVIARARVRRTYRCGRRWRECLGCDFRPGVANAPPPACSREPSWGREGDHEFVIGFPDRNNLKKRSN
jgi:hypothetical protein